MKKTFCFKSILPGSKKWAFGLKTCLKVVLHGCTQKMAVLPPSTGLSDPNFAKFVITS